MENQSDWRQSIMITVYVIAEGHSEKAVIKEVIAPVLSEREIYLYPMLMATSPTQKGGDMSFGKLLPNIRNLLNQQEECIVTTFLDFYKLKTDFPNYKDAMQCNDIYQKIDVLEKALHSEVVNQLNCRPERFIPHIQPHELEALFFSDVTKFSEVEPKWIQFIPDLQQICDKFESPEHINNHITTAPSKRLENILSPSYRKTRQAPLLAQKIGLTKIENECQHFHQWLEKIRQLKPLI